MQQPLIDLTSSTRTGLCAQWCPVCQLWCRDAGTAKHARTTEHVRGLQVKDVVGWW